MSSIAQEESRRTSQRVTWGQKRQMEKGVAFGAQMLGYHLEDGKLTVIEEEAELVKRIFHMYLYEKKSLNAIAVELESKGILTKHKCQTWSQARIQKILRNEKYAGYLIQGRTYTVDYLTHKKGKRKDDELIIVEDTHEAIISRDEFDQVQAELDRRCSKRVDQKRYSNRYPFSGKLACGECGSTFVSRNRYDEKRFIQRWQCYKYFKYGRPNESKQSGCNSFIIRDEVLQHIFMLAIGEVIKDKGGIITEIMRVLDEVMQSSTTADEQEGFQKELEKAERKKQSLIELYLDGTITKDDMTAVTDRLEKRIQESKEQLKSYTSRSLKQTDFERLREGIRKHIDSIVGGETFSEELCHAVLDKIVIHSKTEFDVFLKGSNDKFFFADSGCILYPRHRPLKPYSVYAKPSAVRITKE